MPTLEALVFLPNTKSGHCEFKHDTHVVQKSPTRTCQPKSVQFHSVKFFTSHKPAQMCLYAVQIWSFIVWIKCSSIWIISFFVSCSLILKGKVSLKFVKLLENRQHFFWLFNLGAGWEINHCWNNLNEATDH